MNIKTIHVWNCNKARLLVIENYPDFATAVVNKITRFKFEEYKIMTFLPEIFWTYKLQFFNMGVAVSCPYWKTAICMSKKLQAGMS